MNFREEYKNQAEVMNPSTEAMKRMTQSILEQVKAPAKKAIPFKKITYIGGTVAACAVIAIGAAVLFPTLSDKIPTADNAAFEGSSTGAVSAADGKNISARAEDDTAVEYAADYDEARTESSPAVSKDGAFMGAALCTEEIWEDAVEADVAEEEAEDNCAPDDAVADSCYEESAQQESAQMPAINTAAPTEGSNYECGSGETCEEAYTAEACCTGEAATPSEAEQERSFAFHNLNDLPIEMDEEYLYIWLDGVMFMQCEDNIPEEYDEIRTEKVKLMNGEYTFTFYGERYFLLQSPGGEAIGSYRLVIEE